MSAYGGEIIDDLIRRAESNPDRVRSVSRKIEEADIDPLDLEEFHKFMRDVERTGGISLEWGKRETSHVLQRVRLQDLNMACRSVGLQTAGDSAIAAVDQILSGIEDPQGWALPYINSMRTAWQRRKSAFGLNADQAENAIIALKAVQAMRERRHEGLDMRTFSSRATGNSKAVEANLGPIVAICRNEFGLADLGKNQVLEALGLQKFPQPVLVSGDLAVTGSDCTLSNIQPYIGLPPMDEYPVKVISPPGYVLTIENLTSFNRYVREVSDNGFVVYSGGYPSQAVGRFISTMAEQIDEEVPWFHWGDIDADGLLILDKISRLANRAVHPHLMEIDLARTKGIPASKSRKLGRLKSDSNPCGELAAFLSSSAAHVLEQEELDPSSPIGGNTNKQ